MGSLNLMNLYMYLVAHVVLGGGQSTAFSRSLKGTVISEVRTPKEKLSEGFLVFPKQGF